MNNQTVKQKLNSKYQNLTQKPKGQIEMKELKEHGDWNRQLCREIQELMWKILQVHR